MPYKQGVTGSSPVAPTIGPVVQLVRMPACHAGGRRFEPVLGRQFSKLKDWNIFLAAAGKKAVKQQLGKKMLNAKYFFEIQGTLSECEGAYLSM